MMMRQRPLTTAERKELAGIVSWPIFLLFAAFWLVLAPWVAMKLLVGLAWLFGLTALLPSPLYLFLLPWLVSAWRFRRGWLRRRPYRADLKGGVAEEKVYELREAIVFPEYEDEGPVIFFRNDDGVFRVGGQEFATLEDGGFVYEQLIESVAPASGHLLGFRVTGGAVPARTAHCCFTDTPLGKEKRFDLVRVRVLPVMEIAWTELVDAACYVDQGHPREPLRPDYVRVPVDRTERFAPTGHVTKEKDILIAKTALSVFTEHAPVGRAALSAQCALIQAYASESVDEDAFVVDLTLPADTVPAESLKRQHLLAMAYVNDSDLLMGFALLVGDGLIGNLHCGLVQLSPRITLDTDITSLRFFEVGCATRPRPSADADASNASPPSAWRLERELAVGGLTDLGLDESERYLMTCSHSGRGIFDLSDGRRVARDRTVVYADREPGELDGIGPLAGRRIAVWGLYGRPVPDALWREAAPFDNDLTELQSVLRTRDGSRFILGFSHITRIYQNDGKESGRQEGASNHNPRHACCAKTSEIGSAGSFPYGERFGNP